MRILLISALYHPYSIGGAERVVRTLATGMAARGHQVMVLTTAPDGRERDESIDGVSVVYRKAWNVYSPFGSGNRPGPLRRAVFHAIDSCNPLVAGRLIHEIRNFDPDVVNTHNLTGFSPSAFIAARRASIPLAHTLHDQYLLCPRTTMYREGNCKRQCHACKPYAIIRKCCASVDLAIGVSEFILTRHREFGVFRNVPSLTIHNAAPAVNGRGNKRREGPLRFGYLGQIRETKGLHLLVGAFVTSDVGDAELAIAGRGDQSYENALRKETEGSKRIRWMGYVDSATFLKSIDILVVPSLWHDTAPLVLLEAFAAGVPVVASSRGGIPEFVTEGTGWLFDPDRPGQLGDILRHCCENRLEVADKSLCAREFAASKGLSRFLDEYEMAYAELISMKRGGRAGN